MWNKEIAAINPWILMTFELRTVRHDFKAVFSWIAWNALIPVKSTL